DGSQVAHRREPYHAGARRQKMPRDLRPPPPPCSEPLRDVVKIEDNEGFRPPPYRRVYQPAALPERGSPLSRAFARLLGTAAVAPLSTFSLCGRDVTERFDRGPGDLDPHPAFMWILAQSAKLVNPSGTSALAAAIRLPASGPKYVYCS